jgi:hypothetical protein
MIFEVVYNSQKGLVISRGSGRICTEGSYDYLRLQRPRRSIYSPRQLGDLAQLGP